MAFLIHYLGRCLKGLTKTTINVNQYSWCSYTKRAPPDYKLFLAQPPWPM